MASPMRDHFGDRMVGIVEDTENGFQKYLGRVPPGTRLPAGVLSA